MGISDRIMTVTATVTSGAAIGAGQEVSLRLRMLATTDLHAHLFSYNYYANRPDESVGLARLAAPILQARAECANILLFDNGDTFQGSPLGDAALSDLMPAARMHPMIAAMNGLGYDAATLGNHDFDYGLETLERIIAAARYPIVLANVFRAGGGGPLVAPHVILERVMIDTSGALRLIRIGVTGATPPQTMQWGHAHLKGQLEIEPILPAVAREVARMRARGVDLVVVLAHTGLGIEGAAPGDENVGYALAALDGVDAVIAGHTHRVFPQPDAPAALERAAPIVQPGFFGSHLGQIDLDLRPRSIVDGIAQLEGGWCVASRKARLCAAEEASAEDRRALRSRLHRLPAFRAEMARGHRLTRAYSARPLGRSAVALETFFSLIAPCAATQLIADAKRAAIAPVIADNPSLAGLPLLACATPFKAGGRGGPEAYTDVPPGAILLRHAADLYPYSNGLALLRANGAQIRAWLERSVSAFRQIKAGPAAQDEAQLLLDHEFASYNFDRFDGLSYQIDLSQPARTNAEGDEIRPGTGRIRDLRQSCGALVRDEDQFLIVTNSYRAGGGGHFPAAASCETVYLSPHPVRDLIAGHIAAMRGALAPSAPQGFSFAPLDGALVVYETGRAAVHHAARASALGLVPDGFNDRGFARFLLRL
jgi:2',3'-cyclic-nucleotide 2'-phosphodiesterase/3'-nucleotidase